MCRLLWGCSGVISPTCSGSPNVLPEPLEYFELVLMETCSSPSYTHVCTCICALSRKHGYQICETDRCEAKQLMEVGNFKMTVESNSGTDHVYFNVLRQQLPTLECLFWVSDCSFCFVGMWLDRTCQRLLMKLVPLIPTHDNMSASFPAS